MAPLDTSRVRDMLQSCTRDASLCGARGDVSCGSLLETWVDEAEKRVGFASRPAVRTGPSRTAPATA